MKRCHELNTVILFLTTKKLSLLACISLLCCFGGNRSVVFYSITRLSIALTIAMKL